MKSNFKILSFVFVFVLLFGVLSFSAFAFSSSDYTNSGLGWSCVSSGAVSDSGTFIVISAIEYTKQSDGFAFCATYTTPSGYNNPILVSTDASFAFYKRASYSPTLGSYTFGGITFYCYYGLGLHGGVSTDYSYPYLGTLSDSDVMEFIFENEYIVLGSPSPSPDPSDFSFDLSPGNAAFVQVSDSPLTHVDITATMNSFSTLWIAGAQPVFWPTELQSIGANYPLPFPGDTFDTSSLIYIPWERGSDRNSFNQTKTAIFSGTPGDSYFVIYNPAYSYDPEYGGELSSPVLHVDLSNAVSVVVYSVTGGTIGNSTLTLGDVSYSPDGSGGWTDSNGGTSSPPFGGGNYVPENGDITSVLSKFVSDIDSFFRGTWNYIQSLVNTLGDFPGYIVELFSWLPDEFRSIILAAFSIVIVIGVLKVML